MSFPVRLGAGGPENMVHDFSIIPHFGLEVFQEEAKEIKRLGRVVIHRRQHHQSDNGDGNSAVQSFGLATCLDLNPLALFQYSGLCQKKKDKNNQQPVFAGGHPPNY
jgi:hypothetical protein